MNATVWGVAADPCVWAVVLACGMNATACEPAAECSEAWLKLATCDAGMVKESVVGVSESD